MFNVMAQVYDRVTVMNRGVAFSIVKLDPTCLFVPPPENHHPNEGPIKLISADCLKYILSLTDRKYLWELRKVCKRWNGSIIKLLPPYQLFQLPLELVSTSMFCFVYVQNTGEVHVYPSPCMKKVVSFYCYPGDIVIVTNQITLVFILMSVLNYRNNHKSAVMELLNSNPFGEKTSHILQEILSNQKDAITRRAENFMEKEIPSMWISFEIGEYVV